MLSPEVKKYIDNSVLCWLATVDENQWPNVSPKETFAWYGTDLLLIGNIASPGSLKNTEYNPRVCVSFVDVFVQKGFKLKGEAAIIRKSDPLFPEYFAPLGAIAGTAFPVTEIWAIRIISIQAIIAPGYFLIPGTTEESQIISALSNYTSRLRRI